MRTNPVFLTAPEHYFWRLQWPTYDGNIFSYHKDVPGSQNQVDVENFDTLMKNVNFATRSFLENPSTADEAPIHARWASPTDAGQVSNYDEYL